MSTMTASLDSLEVDQGYRELEKMIRGVLKPGPWHLFRTDVDVKKLWNAYLDGLETNEPSVRQHYNCHCCRHFIERFGGLVAITPGGHTESVMWRLSDVPEFFAGSLSAMAKLVEKAKVVGVFLSADKMLGTERSEKGWSHLCAINPNPYSSLKLTASQREAELSEDFRILSSTMNDYSIAQVETALTVLKSEQFPGYEKGVGIAEWFLAFRKNVQTGGRKSNLIWAAVASAPPGFAHINNTMVGTLFEDIKNGKTFEQCKRAWADKMHPLKYQRPTAPVSDGQIAAAEKLVEKMGIVNSLRRRVALLSDIRGTFWIPKDEAKKPASGGVFGHLREEPKAPTINIPGQNVTWAKFQRDVLPGAFRIEVECPSFGGYCGVLTAADMAAPPILQWDNEGVRNPASHYYYHGGSSAGDWGLVPGWNQVVAISPAPHGNVLPNHRKFILFSIFGAFDKRGLDGRLGLTLFPECLKTELREIRSVIEAHSNKGHVEQADIRSAGDLYANGLTFNEGNPLKVRINGTSIYTIDRWE